MRANGDDAAAELLYDPNIISKLDFSKARSKFEPKISASNPGAGLLVRPLSTEDFDKGTEFASQTSNFYGFR
jgi:hypothetical protein